MTESTDVIERLPTARPEGCPFDPPGELTELTTRRPLTRLTYDDGHSGWLVTSHELVRAVLADPRFSIRPDLRHNPLHVPGSSGPAQPPPPGALTAFDPPEHTRLRHELIRHFTVRRMRKLTGRVEEITAGCLDAMEEHGQPVDLMPEFALPIPSQVICELLGVAYDDRDRFQGQMTTLMRVDASREEKLAAYTSVYGYLYELVLAKRAEPTDDLLSDLVNGNDADLGDAELAMIGFTLLGAGFETTANMLGLGTYALLGDPERVAALRGGPEHVEHAVEELLRYLSIVAFTLRTALEDVELDGQVIREGETVTLSIAAANRDPHRFTHPGGLDLDRSGSGHLAFGHGVHQCLGQQLARVEMRVAFPALFDRFPTLRLATPPDRVPMRDDMLIYGVHELPVSWDPPTAGGSA